MANKEDQEFVLNSDVGNSFEDEDEILNYKPVIEWEEPVDDFLQDNYPVPIEEDIDSLKGRTQGVIDGYDRVNKLATEVQKQIDARVQSLGGLDVQLDPNVDAAVIDAMKRRFPTKDPTKITYNMYKQALNCLQQNAIAPPAITAKDIQDAKNDPTRTNFGGLGNKPGENRPEVSSPANAMKPVDLNKFQKKAILKAFKLMEGLVSNNSNDRVKKHEKEYKHQPSGAGKQP